MEKTLEITPCELADALPWLAQVTRPKADTNGGLATVQDICKNAQVFRVTSGGREVGAYAVEPYEFDRGTCLFVVAGAGRMEGVDLTASMARVVEIQAMQSGAKQVGMITHRRALANKLAAMGWQAVGIKMVKKI